MGYIRKGAYAPFRKFLDTVLPKRGEKLIVANTTDCSGENTGAIQTLGGAYIAKNLLVGGTVTLGSNTIYSGNMTGNWAMNSGNVSGMGTLGCGAITSSGAYNGTKGTFSDNILFSSTDKGIFANTVDTADSYKVSIGGGGTDSGIRGAFIRLHGNEDTPKGDLWLSAGRGDSSTDRGQVFIYNGFENLIATFGTAIGGVDTTFAGAVKVGAYTLPATDGTSGQVLVTNGSGVLTWTTL